MCKVYKFVNIGEVQIMDKITGKVTLFGEAIKYNPRLPAMAA